MKKLHHFILAACLVIPQTLHAQFEEASTSTRSTALGGMFTHVADDPSALFINCAGLVNSVSPVLYGDFSGSSGEGYGGETMIAALYPTPWITVGAGWYRRGLSGGDIEDENVLIAGLARKLLTNTGGSYLSVGAALKVGRLAYESSCDCPGSGSSESRVTGDLGLILRPLPVISIGYSMLTVKEADFEEYGSARSWNRLNRWGISYFWEDRVVVGFEQQRSAGRTTYHYGLAVRTSTPIEILAGFDDGDVQGGIRWIDDIVRVSVAFGSGGDRGIHARASVEVGIPRGEKE
jgi:hypothetical protein